MKSILCVILTISVSNGFLFDTTSPGTSSGGSVLTDTRYYALLDMIMQERRYRRQMEHYLTNTLQTDLEGIKNETLSITNKYEVLRKEYLGLKNTIADLKNNTGSHSDLQEMRALVNTTQQETMTQMLKIESSVDAATHGLTDLQNEIAINLTSFQSQITMDMEMVGFTACGGFPTSGFNPSITFGDIKTSYGISNLTSLQTTGKFTCEKAGLYFISVTLMSRDSNARFNMFSQHSGKFLHLGSVQISPLHHLSPSDNSNYHSGTGSAVVQLDVMDTIKVSPIRLSRTITSMNCITMVKLK